MTASINATTSQSLILGTYIPRRFQRASNPADAEISRRVLELKQGQRDAIDYFFQILDPLLPPSRPVCMVPSHQPANIVSGIRLLAQRLAASRGRIDATQCLIRFTTTPQMRYGSPRSEGIHFESITTARHDLLTDNQVILLDDVISSGCSMRACKALLLSAGAATVYCVALTKTRSMF